jgi:metalloprotein, YbeY/UPF0054 family
MILLDPDLASDAALRTSAAIRKPAAESQVPQLPSTRALAAFLTRAVRAVRLRGQVTVLLTTDAAQRNLNRRFRGKNQSTDVLSFPADSTVPGGAKIAGDLSISLPMASRQAAQHGHPLLTEIKVLILHGVLHLAGYDHETDSGEMARREQTLRARLHLPGGLIERTVAAEPMQRQKRSTASRGRRR